MVTYGELFVKAWKFTGYSIYGLANELIMVPLYNIFNKIAWKNYWMHPSIFELTYKIRNKIGKHLDGIEERTKLMAEELDTDCYVLTGMRVKELNNYFWHNRS